MEKNKKIFLVVFLLIIFLTVGWFFIFKNKKNTTKEIDIEPTSELIPTVSSSVKVEFKSIKKGEALLIVSNEPKDTSSIDFELSYQVINNDVSEEGEGTVTQGAIGKCYKFTSQWQCGESNYNQGRKIILGTCSSGTCRYHDIVGPVKITLRFTGGYGQRIFEKEYQL